MARHRWNAAPGVRLRSTNAIRRRSIERATRQTSRQVTRSLTSFEERFAIA